MMAYATPVDLATFTQTKQSDTFDLVLELASSAIDAHVGHTLTEGSEQQALRATGGRELDVVPPGWPLKGVTVTVGDDELTEGEHFRVRADGVLWRIGAPWRDTVEVSYTTGFAPDSTVLLTAKRITLENAARAVGNPQLLDSLAIDGTSPNFLVRDGSDVLPQVGLTASQRRDLSAIRWRRRLA